MEKDKIYTVATLFILAILSYFFGGSIGQFLIKGDGMFTGVLMFLTATIGTVLGVILAIIFVILGLIALFLDVKSYSTFMGALIVGLVIIALPIPTPVDDLVGLLIMGVGLQNSTKPKKDRLITL